MPPISVVEKIPNFNLNGDRGYDWKIWAATDPAIWLFRQLGPRAGDELADVFRARARSVALHVPPDASFAAWRT